MELNRATFRRLVQLHLLLFSLTLASTLYEWFSPTWASFAAEYDALVEHRFGSPPEQLLIPLAIVCMISLIWGLASTVGLLSFKRWARFGFWASFLLIAPLLFTPGFYPYYTTPWMDLAGVLDSMAFGAVLLLAYSREHGGVWFNKSAEAAMEG